MKIEGKNGFVRSITIEDGVGYRPDRKWTGWALRAIAFHMWLYGLKKKGATFRYNGRPVEVTRRTMFTRVPTRVTCACGCRNVIQYSVDWVPNHPPPFWKENHYARKMAPGLARRFPKGHVPWNKGMKGFWAPGMEKGWFKKGNHPQTWKGGFWKPDGYVYVRSKDPNDRYPSGGRRYINLARSVLEKKLGRKLRLYEVAFHLDANRANNSPENLIALKREDSAKRTEKIRRLGRTVDPRVCPHCNHPKVAGIKCRNCGRASRGYRYPR